MLPLAACSAPEPGDNSPTLASTPNTPLPTQTNIPPVPTLTPQPTETPRPKVLRVNGGALPETLDPPKTTLVSEWAHLHLLFEGLTRFDDNLQAIPAAAEKWQYNPTATELTFTLRRGLKYSDGSLLNAARFAYALKRAINPKTAGTYAALLDEIKGAPEWRTARPDLKPDDLKKIESVVDASIQALDTNGKPCPSGAAGYAQPECLTLKLTFARPASYFHVVLGTWLAYPIKEENNIATKDLWNSLRALIGNGAFVVKSIEPGVRVRFEANPTYWGNPPKLAIEYTYQTESAAAIQSFKNNALDVVFLSQDAVDQVQSDATLAKQLRLTPGACASAVMFAFNKEPFTDARVRQAFALATDRDAFVRDILRGIGTPTLTWIPKGFPGFPNDEKRWAFDAAAAKQALAASKYGSASKLPPITMTFVTDARARARYEWLQKQWKQVLDVEVKLNPVDQTTYTNWLRDPKTAPPLYLQSWCALYPDPHYWLSVYWKTGAVAERFKYSNKPLDQLLTDADATADPSKRMELYGKAHELLMLDVAAVFLWNNVNAYLVQPWVKDYNATPMNRWFPGDTNPARLDIDTTLLPK